MTVGRLRELLTCFTDDNDAEVRMGSDCERFDYVDAVGFDSDTNTLIIYAEKTKGA